MVTKQSKQRDYELIKATRERRYNRLQKLKLQLGCKKCGYKKCAIVLEFHHINPDEKEFMLNKSNCSRSWVSILVEIKKCDLLCANCHRERYQKESMKKLSEERKEYRNDVLLELSA